MKRTLYREGGQALVEFALVFPLLVLIIMGILDLGQGVYAYNVVSSAAREGARFGVVDPTNTSGIQSQAVANTAALNPGQMQQPVVECSNDSFASTQPCNANPSPTFIRVTVTYTYQPLTLFFASVSLTGRSMMAIEP